MLSCSIGVKLASYGVNTESEEFSDLHAIREKLRHLYALIAFILSSCCNSLATEAIFIWVRVTGHEGGFADSRACQRCPGATQG